MAGFQDFLDLFGNAVNDAPKAREQKLHEARADEYKARVNLDKKRYIESKKEIDYYAYRYAPSGAYHTAEYERAKAERIKAKREYEQAKLERIKAERDYKRGQTTSGKANDAFQNFGQAFDSFMGNGSPAGGSGSPAGGSGGSPFGGTSSGGGGGGGSGAHGDPDTGGQPGGGNPSTKMFSNILKGADFFGVPFAGPAQVVYRVITESIEAIRSFTGHLQRSNFEFAKFSSAMANVAAQQMMRDYDLARRRGDRRAASAEYLSERRHQMEEAVSEYSDFGAMLGNYVGGFLAQTAEYAIRNPHEFLGNPAYGVLEKWLNDQFGLTINPFEIIKNLNEQLAGDTLNPPSESVIGNFGAEGERVVTETWDALYGRPQRFKQ